MVYSDGIEDWLRGEGCSVPSVRPGNRYPTMQEMVAAVEAEQLRAAVDDEYIMVLPPPDAPSVIQAMTRVVKFLDIREHQAVEAANRLPLSYLVEIHSYGWDELNVNDKASITMRGNFPLELFLVHNLTERCGQLLLYPDTGEPPVVVEAGCDIGRIASTWLEVVDATGSWGEFYERIGASEGA
jgi:hypothetical protein